MKNWLTWRFVPWEMKHENFICWPKGFSTKFSSPKRFLNVNSCASRYVDVKTKISNVSLKSKQESYFMLRKENQFKHENSLSSLYLKCGGFIKSMKMMTILNGKEFIYSLKSFSNEMHSHENLRYKNLIILLK